MLDKISSRLPLYHDHYDQYLKRRQKDTSGPGATRATGPHPLANSLEQSSQRIMKTMSLLYADIIQFCQEACSIFSKRAGGWLILLCAFGELFS
jgi:hypothetical protein